MPQALIQIALLNTNDPPMQSYNLVPAPPALVIYLLDETLSSESLFDRGQNDFDGTALLRSRSIDHADLIQENRSLGRKGLKAELALAPGHFRGKNTDARALGHERGNQFEAGTIDDPIEVEAAGACLPEQRLSLNQLGIAKQHLVSLVVLCARCTPKGHLILAQRNDDEIRMRNRIHHDPDIRLKADDPLSDLSRKIVGDLDFERRVLSEKLEENRGVNTVRPQRGSRS